MRWMSNKDFLQRFDSKALTDSDRRELRNRFEKMNEQTKKAKLRKKKVDDTRTSEVRSA